MKNMAKKRLSSKQQNKMLCCVSITCSSPKNNGEMQVEMSYEGDNTLIAYLLQSAQKFIEEQEEEESYLLEDTNKILTING